MGVAPAKIIFMVILLFEVVLVSSANMGPAERKPAIFAKKIL